MALHLDLMDAGIEDEGPVTWGTLLKMFREALGLTQTQVADLVKAHQTMISNLELGKVQPDERWAKLLDEVLKANGILLAAFKLAEPFLSQRHPNWDAFKAYLKMEAQALRIYDFSMGRMPGLLQCEAYMRALFTAGNPMESADQIDARMQDRLDRVAKVFRSGGPKLVSVIEEAALWRVVGDQTVMRLQCRHLLEMMSSPQVVLQILPFGRGEVTRVLMRPMTILDRPTGRRVAYSESLGQGHIIEGASQVSRVVDEYDFLRAQALPQAESAEFIRSVMEGPVGDEHPVDQEQLLGSQRRYLRRVRPTVRFPRPRPRA
ncbi:helix-turn-helix transcriptional regulator [Kitasatospora sp. NPDC006697]|uniref:helix-turn-helix domain-containing protein n=1 Tax=Kitasatospora sp. NPDC006697 TaxID=3364020 RepID=UPI0036922A9E